MVSSGYPLGRSCSVVAVTRGISKIRELRELREIGSSMRIGRVVCDFAKMGARSAHRRTESARVHRFSLIHLFAFWGEETVGGSTIEGQETE